MLTLISDNTDYIVIPILGMNMKAVVRRIVDGDTLILDVYIGVSIVGAEPGCELGMGLYVDNNMQLIMRKVRARLYKLYAAEMSTPEGIGARDRLAVALPLGTEVTIEIHGLDKYGRWLVVPMVGTTNVCLLLNQENGAPMGRGIS